MAITTLLLVSWSSQAADSLLGSFQGTFRWEGASREQAVTFEFLAQQAMPNGAIALVGNGRYVADGAITHITIRALLDPVAGVIEIFEADPQSAGQRGVFTTNGSHIGVVDPSLDRIDAVWTSRESGARGALRLLRWTGV